MSKGSSMKWCVCVYVCVIIFYQINTLIQLYGKNSSPEFQTFLKVLGKENMTTGTALKTNYEEIQI